MSSTDASSGLRVRSTKIAPPRLDTGAGLFVFIGLMLQQVA